MPNGYSKCSLNSQSSESTLKASPTMVRGAILIICIITITIITLSLVKARHVNASQEICTETECEEKSNQLLKSMDETVAPCEDFYQFVCGNYINSTNVPDNETTVSKFSLTKNKIDLQLRVLMEEDINEDEPRYSKLAKQSYKLCMDEDGIEKDNLTTIKTMLNSCGKWPVLEDNWNENDFNWTETLIQFRNFGYGVDYYFDITVTQDIKNSSQRIIYLDQPRYGLNRNLLIKGLDHEFTRAYYKYMTKVAEVFGANKEKAAKELRDVLDFEIRLTKISTAEEEQQEILQQNINVTLGDLNKKYTFLAWNEFLDKILSPPRPFNSSELIILRDIKYLDQLAEVLNTTDKRTQANYLIWRVVKDFASYLTKDIQKARQEYEKVLVGRNRMLSRWKYCIMHTTSNFRSATSALYVKKYFSMDKKRKVEEIVNNVKSSFNVMLENVDWMDKETKKHALAKLKALKTHVAYPEELLNDKLVDDLYKKLKFYQNVTFLQSQLNNNLRSYQDIFENLRKPVNKTEWTRFVFCTDVNAYYNVADNSIVISAGLLQDPFFNEKLPNYINYASIGLAIGHELTHGFDDRGRQVDKDGNAVNWWHPDTRDLFKKKAKCFEEQYSNFTYSELKLKINGQNTLDENIADNGGIKETYLAYDIWLKNNKEERGLPKLHQYTNKQLFWIASTYVWCSKIRQEQLVRDIALNVHTPARYRTIGMVSNMKQFSEDFQCTEKSTMNPKNKCSLW